MKNILIASVLFIWVCSGVSVDVESICGPQTTNVLVEGLHNASGRAFQWLSSNRASHFGWSLGNTASAVTSLQLLSQSWIADRSLEIQLTLKQLQLEILSLLTKSERSKIPNIIHLNEHHRLMFSRLPYYIMALHATCQNGSNYHGVDLINTLTNHMRRFRKDGLNDYFQHALSIQALCSTGHPVKWRFIEDLLSGQRQDGCFHKPCPGSCENERIDTSSIVLSALTCVKDTTLSHNLDQLNTSIVKAANCLVGKSQDGSFGNAVNNAMALQALMATGFDHSQWDCHSAMTSVLNDQHEDGHFGSLAATIHIMPLLAGRHHSHIKELQFECPEDFLEDQEPILPPIEDGDNTTMLVTIQVTHGLDRRFHQVHGMPGESLLDLMYRQQELSDDFTFETKTTEWGPFITSINGIRNDEYGFQNWIIEHIVNQQRLCVDKGAGDIYPVDGDHYLWLYHGCASEK